MCALLGEHAQREGKSGISGDPELFKLKEEDILVGRV